MSMESQTMTYSLKEYKGEVEINTVRHVNVGKPIHVALYVLSSRLLCIEPGEVPYMVMDLIDSELSEPYSIFTYRYFLKQWPFLCHLAVEDGPKQDAFGCVVGKMERHRNGRMRGYIGMLTVKREYRYLGIGSKLVRRCIDEMVRRGCEEVVLEAEVTNSGALRLYQNLGFIKDKRLQRYYLNGNDAYRLKLLLPRSTHIDSPRIDSLAITSE